MMSSRAGRPGQAEGGASSDSFSEGPGAARASARTTALPLARQPPGTDRKSVVRQRVAAAGALRRLEVPVHPATGGAEANQVEVAHQQQTRGGEQHELPA